MKSALLQWRRVSAGQGSMRFCPTKISLGPQWVQRPAFTWRANSITIWRDPDWVSGSHIKDSVDPHDSPVAQDHNFLDEILVMAWHQPDNNEAISWWVLNGWSSSLLTWSWWWHYIQSGTKPNLVAQILATDFGIFLIIYVMFSKICSIWV